MDNICRDSIMAVAKDMEWDAPPLLIPGIGIKTGPGDGFPVQQVQMMQWNGENWEYLGGVVDAASAGD